MLGLVTSFASSSRSTLSSLSHFPSPFSLSPTGAVRRIHGGDTRWPKVKPRPARMPLLRSPHHPRVPRPRSGPSTPHPLNLQDPASPVPSTTTKVSLGGQAGLTLHHTPPSAAPVYTTGTTPDLFKWMTGEAVRLTGEEQAPVVGRTRKLGLGGGGLERTWTEEQVKEMQQMRTDGYSRKEIAQQFDIPLHKMHLVSRVAPLSSSQKNEIKRFTAELESEMHSRQKIAHAMRRKRRTYW